MADNHGQTGGHPDMDYAEHDRTYKGFIHFSEVGTVAIIAIVAALAVGGVKHAWFAASMGTILALVTAGIGLAAPSIGWRAPLVALLVMLACLVLM
ncbi:MAG: aa3-type cytochrome c oxidase subunit IV [Bosea sp. (in: a-proteobacteria)]